MIAGKKKVTANEKEREKKVQPTATDKRESKMDGICYVVAVFVTQGVSDRPRVSGAW